MSLSHDTRGMEDPASSSSSQAPGTGHPTSSGLGLHLQVNKHRNYCTMPWPIISSEDNWASPAVAAEDLPAVINLLSFFF